MHNSVAVTLDPGVARSAWAPAICPDLTAKMSSTSTHAALERWLGHGGYRSLGAAMTAPGQDILPLPAARRHQEATTDGFGSTRTPREYCQSGS